MCMFFRNEPPASVKLAEASSAAINQKDKDKPAGEIQKKPHDAAKVQELPIQDVKPTIRNFGCS